MFLLLASSPPPINAAPAFLNHDNILELTELMRQSEYDGIVYIARLVRRGIPISTGMYGNVFLIHNGIFEKPFRVIVSRHDRESKQ